MSFFLLSKRLLSLTFMAVPFLIQNANSQIIPSSKPVLNQRISTSKGEYIKIKSLDVFSPNATQFSHGDPTADEQLSLEFINRARANPSAEGIRLMETSDNNVQSAYTYFNIDKNKTKSAFTKYPVQPPLAFDDMLIKAARKHSKDMLNKNFQGHTGSDGSSMNSRMAKEGYTSWTNIGENVAAYSQSVWYAHCGLNVDWGEQNQIDLGHRTNIMNFTDYVFTEVGIGIDYRPGANFNQTGPFIVTQDFGKRSNTYLCGVVYKDNNNNGFYDAGEGVKGVTITPNKGDFYAISSTSGGYAIPTNSLSGTLSVTASGGPFTTPTTLQVSLNSGENVKLDFLPNLPSVLSLVEPKDEASLSTKSVTFKWNKSSKTASNYAFELASDLDFEEIIDESASLKDTTFSVTDLENGKTYYWRAKAQTSEGWGDWSLAYQFTINIKGPEVILNAPFNGEVVKSKNITLKWHDANADKYKIQISPDEFFLEDVIEKSELSDTTFVIEDVERNITIYWQVQAEADGIWGEWSETYSFTTALPIVPQKAILLAPENNYKAEVNQIELKWKGTSVEAPLTASWLELSKESNFASTVFKDTNLDKESKTFSIEEIGGGKFYWRVKSKNDGGWGEFSNSRSFEIIIASVESVEHNNTFYISPNPANTEVFLKFNISQVNKAKLLIINNKGQVVSTQELENFNVGEQFIPIDISGLISGTYTVQIISGKSKQSTRMVITK